MSQVSLIEAVKAQDVMAVRALLRSGVDVNQSDEQGWTPLNWAAGRGDLALVRLLVEHGADLFKVGRDLRTPYLIALAAGHVQVVKFLRQAEDQVEGEKPPRPQRPYCKAYYLRDLRRFPGWSESRINWTEPDDPGGTGDPTTQDQGFSDDEVVFLHQDYTVTQSMWHNENVLFNQVTSEWQEFCARQLEFKVPDDLDLIVSVQTTAPEDASAAQPASAND